MGVKKFNLLGQFKPGFRKSGLNKVMENSRIRDCTEKRMDNLTNIIAQLEWIYRTNKNYEWRAATKSLFVTYLDDVK